MEDNWINFIDNIESKYKDWTDIKIAYVFHHPVHAYNMKFNP